jgi:hypothetical protein
MHPNPLREDYYQQLCSIQLGQNSIENGIALRHCPADQHAFCFGHLGKSKGNDVHFRASCTPQRCPEGSTFSPAQGHCVARK